MFLVYCLLFVEMMIMVSSLVENGGIMNVILYVINNVEMLISGVEVWNDNFVGISVVSVSELYSM